MKRVSKFGYWALGIVCLVVGILIVRGFLYPNASPEVQLIVSTIWGCTGIILLVIASLAKKQ